MKKLNILITNSISFLGGVELFAIKLGKGLIKLGHNVFFVTRSHSRMEEELLNDNIKPISVPMTGDLEPISLYKLYKIIKTKEIDITCATAPRDFRLSGIISKLLTKKGVIFNMGTVWDPAKQSIPHDLRYRRNKFLFDYLLLKGISNSIGGMDYVSKIWSISKDKLGYIYNGVDLNIFNPRTITRNIIKQEYNIPSESLIVTLIGRISPEKGHFYFLEAAKLTLDIFPNTYFLIVGESTNDEYYAALKTMWKQINGKEHIIFSGFRQDIQNILADTDILVLPSSQEGLPNVVLEALAMSCPVVATQVCATNEAVLDGNNGFLINSPIDVSELYNKITKLLSDARLRNAMGENGRKLIEEKFNIENNIKEYEKIFYELI